MKICCAFNYNPLYDYPIYLEMDRDFNCDFFFGDFVPQPIKQFPADNLKGFKKVFHTRRIPGTRFYFSTGIRDIFNKSYTHYILTGDIYYLINWMVLIYAKISHKKIYFWTHGQNRMITKKIGKLFFGSFFAHADGIFMYNHANCKYMESFGCPKERLHVIHNSLDSHLQTRIFSELKESDIYKKHFNNNNKTVIFIGRVLEARRLDLLIKALALLKKEGVDVNCAIIGPIIEGEKLQQVISEEELSDHVWFYGPCYDENKNAELIYNAAACISPSYIGLTAIHALSYGTPVIANDNAKSNGPEIESIEHHLNGSFFKENNIESLAEEIKFWTKITGDDRENVRQAARRTIEDGWSVDYQVHILKKALNITEGIEL